jgi:hypothetical protein
MRKEEMIAMFVRKRSVIHSLLFSSLLRLDIQERFGWKHALVNHRPRTVRGDRTRRVNDVLS